MSPLSAKRRSELRSEAHKLSPVVIIGDKGLTDEVIAEIDRSLRAHELIKVRAATDDRDARSAWIESICEKLQAHAVQQIGKMFVIYRENPKEEKKKPVREKSGPGPSLRRSARGDGDQRKPRGAPKPFGRGRGDEERKPRGAPKPRSGARGDDEVKGISRPRSRTPSPLPESGPRRRRPRTSR